MEWLASLLPVTALAAISLFVVKEIVEAIKRWRADARKGRAFRTLLARECELNHWTHKRLEETLLVIQKDFQKQLAAEYSIERRKSGDVAFRREEGGERMNGWALPEARAGLMSKVMLDVAILDKSLFASLEAAYDATMSMSHVRESLIHFIETDDQHLKNFFSGFPEYGLSELEETLVDLKKLYRKCTGKKLESFRLR